MTELRNPVPVAQLSELAPGCAKRAVVNGLPVAVVMDSDGSVHTLADTCSHEDVSLSEGDVSKGRIECWGHGSEFDLRTGVPMSLPAIDPVAVFAHSVEDETVFVDTDTVLNDVRAQ